MASASFQPCLPVQALALPELTTMACAMPFLTRSMQTFTGAAQTWLVVNMPATVAGTSETMSARSRFLPFSDPFPVPSRLMSQKTPEARKPLGATMEPGMSLNFAFMKLDGSANDSRGSLRSEQPRRFGEAAQEVKALHRLAAGAFDQVVLGAEDDETAGAWIQSPGDFDDVGARHILGVGQSR